MANIKSQIKRNRTNEAARLRNKSVKSALKTSVRKFREAGVPPFKVRTLREQASRWHPAALADAIVAMAVADAAVKGRDVDGRAMSEEGLDREQGTYALERALLPAVRHRSAPERCPTPLMCVDAGPEASLDTHQRGRERRQGPVPEDRPLSGSVMRQAVLASSAARVAIADLRFAAWFLWMTPLLAALSRARVASRASSWAFAASAESAASRNLRTEVFSADLTDLLRRRAASLVRLRLICDLMFATFDVSFVRSLQWRCRVTREGCRTAVV